MGQRAGTGGHPGHRSSRWRSSGFYCVAEPKANVFERPGPWQEARLGTAGVDSLREDRKEKGKTPSFEGSQGAALNLAGSHDNSTSDLWSLPFLSSAADGDQKTPIPSSVDLPGVDILVLGSVGDLLMRGRLSRATSWSQPPMQPYTPGSLSISSWGRSTHTSVLSPHAGFDQRA